MKTFLRLACGSTLGRGRSSFAAAALLAFGAVAVARGGGDSPRAPNGSGPGSGNSSGCGGFGAGGGDDETVGTLPTHAGGPTFDLVRHARAKRPLLFVQGTPAAVLSSAVVVRGDNHVLAQAMPGGELRLVFLGDCQVSFDRIGFHHGSLGVGVAIPEGSPILRTHAEWNGISIGAQWTYVYELPIAQFEANGLLDLAPIVAGVTTAEGTARVRAQASADLITLTQLR